MANDELLVETEPEPPRPRAPVSAWPALICLVLAVLIWFGFQAWNLQREYRQLQAIQAGQEGPLAQARKRQAQLESIARRLFALSQQGHAGATQIVQELARRGVSISPASPAPAPPK
jgi:hypothetical protein